MLQPKKKISRREMKEDALITTYVKATTFYEQNKKNIGFGLLIAAALVIGSIVYFNKRTVENEKATTDLGKLLQYYDNGQFQIAIEGIPERTVTGLKSIVENYGGTQAGNLARFYLANSYYHVGKIDDAMKQFEDFSPATQLLTVARFSGLGACFETKGQYKDAAEYFEKAATKYAQDINAAENLNSAGRNFGLAGQKQKALDIYKLLKKSYPTTTFAREADRYIAQFSV
jgi:TolA-binding protein